MSGLPARQPDTLLARRPWATACWILFAVGFSLVGSALAAVLLRRVLQAGPESLRGLLVEDPPKTMRRLMILFALPLLPVIGRVAGCVGWRDSGWSRDAARRLDLAWKRDMAVGASLGVLTLGLAIFISYTAGGRVAEPFRVGAALGMAVPILLSAVVISLLEETAVRGFMLNVLQRQWRFWPAAIVASVLFAWGHYLEPQSAAFAGETFWQETVSVLGSTLTRPSVVPNILPRLTNLALMGGVLCLAVRRFGTVWMAVGLHAGWVVVKKLNARLGNVDQSISTLPWIGQRSDAIDGWLTALLLLALGTWFLFPLPHRVTMQRAP